MKKKGQSLELAVSSVIVVGILILIGIVIFAQVRNVTDNQIPTDSCGETVNETVNILYNTSVSLTNCDRDHVCSAVYNSTGTILGTNNYTCTANGEIILHDLNHNSTRPHNVTYTGENETDYHTASNTSEGTTLDAFTLMVVALIVLAAAAILGILIKAFRV